MREWKGNPELARVIGFVEANLRKQLALGHTVASRPVGHDHARHIQKAFSNFQKECLAALASHPG
jgi:hypothetical protein